MSSTSHSLAPKSPMGEFSVLAGCSVVATVARPSSGRFCRASATPEPTRWAPSRHAIPTRMWAIQRGGGGGRGTGSRADLPAPGALGRTMCRNVNSSGGEGAPWRAIFLRLVGWDAPGAGTSTRGAATTDAMSARAKSRRSDTTGDQIRSRDVAVHAVRGTDHGRNDRPQEQDQYPAGRVQQLDV